MGLRSASQHLWVFYNIPKGAYFNGLTFQEARAIAKILSPDERIHWLVWKEGWPQWKKMSAASELLVTTSTVLRVTEPPSLPEEFLPQFGAPNDLSGNSKSVTYLIDDLSNKEVSVHVESENDGENNSMATTPLSSDAGSGVNTSTTVSTKDFVVRKDERVAVEIDVEIISQGRKFKTKTVDLSIGGVFVRDVLPQWIAGYSTLILRRDDLQQSLEFVCTVVENQDPFQKRRLEIHPTADTIHLKRWLLDFKIKSKQSQTG